MKFCKYCNKPIDGESVWNPDKDGNGYHHSCLCEMEFKSRDKRIYNKGRTDVLEQIRAEIMDTGAYEQETNGKTEFLKGIDYCLSVFDKYMAESEDK